MGITRELARSVFSKSRSFGTQHDHANNQKKIFRTVRSYLCGDELINSVMAEEDSASIKSSDFTISHPISESYGTTIINIEPEMENSEITVTQPVNQNFRDEGEIESKEDLEKGKGNSTATLFQQEDAALIIQSAFRRFMARRRDNELNSPEDKTFMFSEVASPSRGSVGTSVEVQTGNSLKVFATKAEAIAFHNRLKQKARIQASKLKDDWDDSTVSSNISKLRIRSKLEATTRRERALAYAFSQQLRVCSKKKQNRSDDAENMGWSWLERWMATRAQDNESFENNAINQIESISINRRSSQIRKNLFNLPSGEMESCGSNEVSIQTISDAFSTTGEKYGAKTTKNRLKAARSISRRKTAPSYHYREFSKINKKECSKEEEKVKKPNNTAIKREHAASQLSPDDVASNYSKLGQ